MRWPMPLAPFELLMLVDDRPGYPMTYAFQCDCAGTVNRAQLEQAVALAVERQPLLTALVDDIRGRPHWVPAGNRPAPVRWSLADWDRSAAIDLRREPGVRVWVDAAAKDPGRIYWQFHHACCDAMGAINVLADWLAIYTGLATGREYASALADLTPAGLDQRANFRRRRVARPAGTRRVGPAARWRHRWNSLQIAWRVLRARPCPIPATVPAPVPDPGQPAALFTVRTLDATATARLRATLTRAGLTLNDHLVATLFRVLAAWNQQHAGPDPRRLVRVTVPISLRVAADKTLPAANVLSYAFLDRREPECADAASLAAGLHRDLRAIRRYNLSRQFVENLARGARWPAFVRYQAHRPVCRSTAVLSHLAGSLRRLDADDGPLRLVAVCGAPPIRPGTALSMCAMLFRGALSVSARGDRRCLAPAAHEALVDQYCAGLVAGEKASWVPEVLC